MAGLLLITASIEACIRLRSPFLDQGPILFHFVRGVGYQMYPDIELRFTNNVDFWTVQRTNSLGFLDRELVDPARAAESCHITVIGDSFIEGREVPIFDKLQVRLEELAAREAPHLDITTSAFGIQRTGQLNQLPLYDGYARHLGPDVAVLVFTVNDLRDNSTFASALIRSLDPYHMPRVHAARTLDGSMGLGMPDPDFASYMLRGLGENSAHGQPSIIAQTARRLRSLVADNSYFARWMEHKIDNLHISEELDPNFIARAEYVMNLPEYTFMSEGWVPDTATKMWSMLESELTSPISLEAWESTEFSLQQFKRRADHDGVAMMILAVYDLGGKGDPLFDRLSTMAESLDIPVVSQHDYIVSQGGLIEDARFIEDYHWSPTGHRWAAQAVWEHISTEWDGKCPHIDPDSDVAVEWIKVGHHIHTSEGKIWADTFPMNTDIYRAALASVTDGSPTAISDWNVHIYDDGVTYVKEPCVMEDVETPFFLHVVPEAKSDLPAERQSIGFDKLDFYFGLRGAMFDGLCMVSADLPEYDIASINTGQFSDGVQTWRVGYNFALPDIMHTANELLQSEREPAIRSVFDVYIDDGRLVYAKDSCNIKDGETPFFLHVFPADEADLPAGREESGFDNLGFELVQKGGMHDGVCFAAVALPNYEISSIRTGQVADSAETWRARYNFSLPGIIDAVNEFRRSEREPDIRSSFDIYIDDSRLVYVKDSCDADDRDTSFFLHVVPAHEKDLAEGREESGFNNLGFELTQRGGVHDGDCFAVARLPEYGIANIRTGQWIRDEGNVWEASIDFE